MTDEPQASEPSSGEPAAAGPSEHAPSAPIEATAPGPSESAAPATSGSATPPASGWAAVPSEWTPPVPAPAPAPAGRIRTTVIPLIVLGVAVLLAVYLAFGLIGPRSTAYQAGYAFGSAIGAGLILGGIVFVIARKAVGASQPGRYRLFGAAAMLAGVLLVGVPSLATVAKPAADPATGMVIAAPYTLTAASTEVQQGFAGLAQGKAGYAVKMVEDANGSTVAILLAVSGAGSSGNFWADFDAGAQTSTGVTSTPTQFNGKEARLLAGSGAVGIAYVSDSGLMMAVYATSEASARAIAEAQVQAASATK